MVSLANYKSLPSIRERALLYKSNVFNNYSRTVLLVLADRSSDQVAKKFVKTKLENTC